MIATASSARAHLKEYLDRVILTGSGRLFGGEVQLAGDASSAELCAAPVPCVQRKAAGRAGVWACPSISNAARNDLAFPGEGDFEVSPRGRLGDQPVGGSAHLDAELICTSSGCASLISARTVVAAWTAGSIASRMEPATDLAPAGRRGSHAARRRPR